ncbi:MULTISPECIES: AraC family transcriptional regulator [Bacillus]|uniref:AraC family transcriptional regulator n=1 Tax=Bacillus TaxID=1386 RepID=UPI000C77E3F3|nr:MULTISPECIES: AraC family transcriptional regulator [Bacillus]PLR87763.1 AraC family transcriptional regulator [Bacillus sp. V33-4]RSK55208.1 AraC family transcriptional regulator [Bacillus canaveralius]
MDLTQFTSGKIHLNQYATHLKQNGASIHVHYWGVMPKHYDNLRHKHSFFEICYVVEGKGKYLDDGQTHSLQENTMFLSRPDVLHQIKSEQGLFLLYVAFELIESESSEQWIRIMEEAKTCSRVSIEVKDDTTAALLWKSMLIQSTKFEHIFFEEILNNLAFSLIASLLQTFVHYSHNDHHHKILPEACSPLLNQATLYIKDNLSQSLKLTDAARHFHISGRHLSRLFVSELGVSYSEYVQNERIQRAATLLKTTDLSIKDIAEKTGFTTVHYFTRVFTSALNSSPGRFRALYTDLKTTTYNDEAN